MKKISFLIAAHNEEKLIGGAIDNLLRVPYEKFEILIGLDGCTDGTEEIVRNFSKKNKKIKYFILDSRSGKPEVINSLLKKATGEIIIIHDADWLFINLDKRKFSKLIEAFNNKKIGGVAEAFPMEWDETNLKTANFGYKMISNATYCWMESEKKKYTYQKNNLIYVKKPVMFMTNIMLKKLFKPNTSLGDDFERTRDIIANGYEIVLFDDQSMPRRKTAYNKISISDLFKQKKRTAVARNQISSKDENLDKKYYFNSVMGTLWTALKMGPMSLFYAVYWTILTTLASMTSSKKLNTKKGWTLRAKR